MTSMFLLQEAVRPQVSMWGVVIPAAIFLIAFLVTMALYRHFARQTGDGGDS